MYAYGEPFYGTSYLNSFPNNLESEMAPHFTQLRTSQGIALEKVKDALLVKQNEMEGSVVLC